MKIDPTKVIKNSNSSLNNLELLIEAQLSLLEALHIMDSIIENPDKDLKEYHEQRIKLFVKQFVE